MERIRQYLEKTVKMTDQDWQIFSGRLTQKMLPKKHTLLQQGQVENHLSFIESGIVRIHIPNENNSITSGFVFEGSFVSGYDSFLTRLPSVYEIQTLTPTRLFCLSYDDLQFIYNATETGNRLGRAAAEELFLLKSKRELALLNQNAAQRYLSLFSERPELIKNIPLKYIASYIGVTPQALSRIRRRIT